MGERVNPDTGEVTEVQAHAGGADAAGIPDNLAAVIRATAEGMYQARGVFELVRDVKSSRGSKVRDQAAAVVLGLGKNLVVMTRLFMDAGGPPAITDDDRPVGTVVK